MKKRRFSTGQSSIAWLLLLIFSWSIFQPSFVFAGGPNQPESSTFTPIGVSDMVDPFTGDFTYNIPLMDVEGYPINIAYNSGVSMDQEATWVGLGWNLNAGAITRALRGLPDDFKGDQVTKVTSTKPVINVGIDFGLKPEIIGFSIPMGGAGSGDDGSGGAGMSFNTGLTYNNYTGYGTSISAGTSFTIANASGSSLTGGFSLSGSSENGASFAPSLSFGSKDQKNKTTEISKTATIGAAYNSRGGLQNISYDLTSSKNKYRLKMGLTGLQRGKMKSSNERPAISGSYDLGLNQYSPTPLTSTWGASIALSVNLSLTAYGFDGQGNIGLSFSKNWIPDDLKTKTNPAFGYLFSESGQNNANALLDFNRDNDQAFSKYSVHLPSTFQTYDIFSISAQGTGGSFRAFRNDVGYVFDPASSNFDVGVNAGFELGAGGLTDIGIDIQVPFSSTRNGVWSDRNYAKNALQYKYSNAGDIVPSYAFIEASEASVAQDNLMTDQFNGDKLEMLQLGGSPLLPKLNGALIQPAYKDLYNNKKSRRELTNNQLYFLNRAEVQAGMGVMPYNSSLYDPSRPHHIAEITQLGTDGRRYIFGLPAYNHTQEDVTFAVGDDLGNSGGIFPDNDYLGLVTYTNGGTLASVNNDKGIDHYYSSSTTPAYAHSYMLSAVLSDDYIDSDSLQGPSKGDLGSYVKFDYTEIENHRWRTPIQKSTGYYNIGMRTDKTDDKASFVYGEKDLFYLYKIETKNYIAIFQTSPREDAHSATDRHGGLDASSVNAMQQLNSITLYSRRDYEANGTGATPIQKVEFTYDYSLCDHYPGNINGNGKLTLKEIKFTYQNSQKMKYRSYKFDYSTVNPDYDLKASDRWGTYKPNWSPGSYTNEGLIDAPLSNADFPYTNQDKNLTDTYAEAWSLTRIKLPSGGEINVEYESDDYAYVQHKKASRMFKIVGLYTDITHYDAGGLSGAADIQSVSNNSAPNRKLLFKLVNQDDDIYQYAQNGQQLYFRALMVLNPAGADLKGKAEFVSGYGIIKSISKTSISGTYYGLIELEPEGLRDAGPNIYSPIAKQAILFGRTQLPRTITDVIGNSGDVNETEQGLTDFANATIGAFASLKELATGPNRYIYDLGRGREMVVNKSWIRLYCPDKKKLGGGSRVKRILIKDNWDAMGGGAASTYGQEFSYTLEDGKTSSGVASYEPQLGGDENTWHTAYIVNNKKRLATDDRMYIEDPIMESQFPSPSVGYSRVEIRDLKRANVTHTATGKVVKEFYTAKDFPTIVKATGVSPLSKQSFLPLLPKYQYLTANEGFLIELNDMHGKPKVESVYAENKIQPLSTVKYFYKSENLALGGVENRRLTNLVKVINPDGTITEKNIGVRYDAVADFRESETVAQSGKLKINTNSMLFGPILAVIPVIYPGYDRTTNRFRSSTFNKTVQKFGILERTEANQDGSIVETNNLAYDANTGEVLVTQTTTNFNDKVYSLNYPAYWKYDAFSQASKNVAYSYKATLNSNGFAPVPPQYNYFTEGDEVSVATASSTKKGWIIERSAAGIRIIDKAGNPITGSNATIKVIRSGHRNKQNTSMASMTTLSNPLQGIGNNQFAQVLNAGAVEFDDIWKTYCDCFGGTSLTTNPYVLGTRGNWRPVRSYTHLSGRTQTNYDRNTNIRKDGVFTSYSPFYKLGTGKWEKDGQNWTFVSEVTEFSPNGMTLETRDALGRYSSSLFEFNNTLTTAVAANAKGQQIATGSFEDAGNTNCMEQSYFSKAKIGDDEVATVLPNSAIETTHVHTGRKSIKVQAGAPVVFENVISTCTVEPVCAMELIQNVGISSLLQINGGEPPYQVSYELDGSNDGEAVLWTHGQVKYNMSGDGTITITVKDVNGCTTQKVITIAN